MENLEKRHKNVGLGKDLGARMKLLTDQFNTKLGEISDYMFSVVGKEVNRNLDQISENITKIQSDSKTYKMLYQNSSAMEEKLREDHEQMRQRMKQRALLSKSVNGGSLWGKHRAGSQHTIHEIADESHEDSYDIASAAGQALLSFGSKMASGKRSDSSIIVSSNRQRVINNNGKLPGI